MMHSIKRQIACVTFAILFCTLFLSWGLNNLFLERVYYSEKQETLITLQSKMASIQKQSDIATEDFQLQMEEYCDNSNLTLMVVNASMEVLYCNENNYDNILAMRLFDYVYGINKDHKSEETNYSTVLRQTDAYKIMKTKDIRFNAYYMEIMGIMDCGGFFVARTPLESIRENIAVSNRFLGFIACVTLLLGTICIWYVSERITRPLHNLINLSRQMTQLNFEAKYEGGGADEIDALGDHMNQLSTKLEETISDLKTANNQLQKDIEQKTQIDEMRKEFLSNVSHELKTPIALIQGYAEGLLECINDDPESRAFYCEVIIDESAKMNRMVQKLLTLNQIEFGNDMVSMERFDLTSLINNIIQSMKLLTEQKEAEVIFNTDAPCYVWADEYKIEEVVTNYLSNALNHVDNEKKIEIRMDKQEGKVRVSVFNTGSPIPEEDIDKIWIKFYKVDKARTREYGGSGIGLSIVKAIMESMNQECGVVNYENGVGFWFTAESAENNEEFDN